MSFWSNCDEHIFRGEVLYDCTLLNIVVTESQARCIGSLLLVCLYVIEHCLSGDLLQCSVEIHFCLFATCWVCCLSSTWYGQKLLAYYASPTDRTTFNKGLPVSKVTHLTTQKRGSHLQPIRLAFPVRFRMWHHSFLLQLISDPLRFTELSASHHRGQFTRVMLTKIDFRMTIDVFSSKVLYILNM